MEQPKVTDRNIRAEMARYDLTNDKLAEITSVSTVSISNKLNGRRPWTLAEAKMLVDYFNALGGKHTIESLFYNKVPEIAG